MARKQAASNGRKSTANGNGTSATKHAQEVAETKTAHDQIKRAQDTDYKHSYGHVDMRDEQIIGGGKERALVRYNPGIVISEKGRESDKKLDEHEEYEFGGPWGVTAMMTLFPVLMYYLWICLWFYDGQFVMPKSIDDIPAFFSRMGQHVYEDAFPTVRAFRDYGGLMVFQFVLAVIVPGYMQEGLPVPSLNYKTLMYKCNALGCFYITLIVSAALHLSGLYRLTTIIEHFGEYMTVSMIVGFAVSFITYFHAVWTNTAHRMSGNFAYDVFMGAALNPRIGPVDLKMWLEVRIPWVLLFLISVSGACKQYEVYGYVTPNMAFMVLCTGLYINACAKGEECIPQTWDMFHEKWGFMVIFWNFAGVPFTYCYSIVYMAAHPPHYYRFSTPTYIAMYSLLIFVHWVFDSSMAQKSRFRMQLQGTLKIRNAFPQWPWSTLSDPRYLQTEHGNALLIDGWWQYLRKPNYSADWTQSFLWGACAGTRSIIPYYYALFFLAVLTHRCGRDFERCARKYGKDWEKYCKIVPYRFIPFVY
ncbi:putative ERG4-sterol C-24 reductase [Meira miltonrushii]|uniref:Delta(24(24(1)))-sterol reductase n=1 Tax=Meira miltonrushii TaxID=1280837 RepID=A0A316VL26_9BASI|nr:putative ERG4-sterol C-24 reductase [Meira miltonrushii]PWN36771.1 putative ERG4-sterol C-24 reductase [Meira miltonrushii]